MRRGIQTRRGKRAGFTLLEILLVAGIMAILAAMLGPVFVRASENAKLTRCMSNLKQIGEACMMYLADHSETFPVGYSYQDPGVYKRPAWPTGQAVGGRTLGVATRDSSLPYEYLRPLWRYTKQARELWRCPSEPKYYDPGRGDIKDYEWFGNCYPMNLTFGAPPGVYDESGREVSLIYTLAGTQVAPHRWIIGRRLNTVTRPTRIILFGERGIHQYWNAGKEPSHYAGKFRNHDKLACRVPVCFVDGHVQYVLITGDEIVEVNGEMRHTYGLWGKGWALMESGWIRERPDIGLPTGI